MVFTKAQAKSLAILDVAKSLGMEIKRSSHKEYYWTEHDSFKIDITKNTWHWYSRGTFGDTINLVQEIRGVSYKEAMAFLETGHFPEAKPREEIRQPFRYTLAPYEQPFREARTYLKEVRGLSDETIDFFLEKGVLAQARRKDRDGFIEDVLVFKYLDRNHNIVGASLQGLVPYPERHEGKGYLKQIMYQSEGIAGLNVSIGSPERLVVAEAPIDLMSYYELHKDSLENVRLVAMEGLKEGVLSRYTIEALQEQGVLVADGHRDYTKASDLTKTSQFLSIAARTSTLFHDHKQDNLITLAVDNDQAGTDFLENLREKKIPIIDARPPKGAGQEKMDWNEYLRQESQEVVVVSEAKEKPLDNVQETDNIFGQQKNAEGTIGDFPENQEAAPLPEANMSQPLNDLSPSQTQPQPLLHFSINEAGQSINKRHYHAISNKELVKLNRYAGTLQQAANWYLNELADSKINYFYQENDSIQTLQVLFDKDKFQHLTGVFPYKEGQSAEQTLEDFANGNGAFDTILLANKGAAFDKLKVLPELPAIVESDSFYFGDLSEVQKLHSLDLDKAIKSGDEDIILALRTVDNTTFPASLMKLRTGLKNQLAQSAEENIILGVYRERAGQIDQLSINEEYVKDGGQEMLSILENKQYEEALEPTQKIVNNDEMSAELFTQVLDAAYNVGDPRNLGVQVPEESKAAWERYYELSDKHEGNFDAVVDVADQMGLVDKESNFYQEWNQDCIYNENHQIHPQRTEDWEERGPQLPFNRDSDSDGISDEEELKQGTNPHDFRSKPESRPLEEQSLEPEEVALASSSLAVADFIKNKDVAGLNRHLKEGIKDYLDSDKYKDYLTKMSQLNNYSSRNLRLILAQNPEAKQVASFKQWKETFGRYVKKGEQSIRIFAPMTKIKKDENNQPVLDKNGKPETVTFFGLVPVFDVSQTDGKEMPKATSEVKEQLADLDYANLYRALMAIAKENDVTVRFDEMTGNKKGHYNVTEHQIVLRSNDMNKSQLIKTFIHETAHSELHHANNPQQSQLTRSTAELQAESVAYVVASYYGIDTSDYSFAYLAGWSDDKETLADLEAQLDIVQQEAKSLTVRMDQQLEQLRLAQEKQTKHHFEQKLQKFKDQSKQAIEENRQEQKAASHSKKEKGFSK